MQKKINTHPRLTLLILLSLFSHHLLAQKIQAPFAITTQQDTIWGAIGSAEYDKENQLFSFFDEVDSLVEFSGNQLSAFFFKNRLFKNITYQKDGLIIQNLYEAILTSKNLSLFYKSRAKNRTIFLVESNGIITELTPPEKNNKNKETTDRFIQQLNKILTGCPDSENILNSTSYTAKSLKRTFVNYLDCQSSEYDLLKDELKLKVNIGPTFGYNSSKIEFNGRSTVYEELTDTDFNSSKDPYVGLFFELNPQVGQGHWSIFNEVGFFAAKYRNNSDENFLNLSFLELNHTLRFTSNSGGLDIYLEAGGGNQFILRQESTLNSRNELNNGFKKLSHSFLAGIGLKRGMFSAGIQYKKNGEITQAESFSSKSSATRIVVRIDFY